MSAGVAQLTCGEASLGSVLFNTVGGKTLADRSSRAEKRFLTWQHYHKKTPRVWCSGRKPMSYYTEGQHDETRSRKARSSCSFKIL